MNQHPARRYIVSPVSFAADARRRDDSWEAHEPERLEGIETSNHQIVRLDGDEPTLKVLGDKRLDGFEARPKGRYEPRGAVHHRSDTELQKACGCVDGARRVAVGPIGQQDPGTWRT